MARIIVWAKADNDSVDPVQNARKYKRGMVVDVLEDGQWAGNDVEAGGWWRIVEVPGPASDFSDLRQADPDFYDDKKFKSKAKFPRKRLADVDLDALELSAGIPPDRPDLKITVDKNDFYAKKKAVAELDNPNPASIGNV